MSLRALPGNAQHPAPEGPARVQVGQWRRMEIETARKLVSDLEQITPEQLAGPLGVFWLGRITGAAQNLLDILDAVIVP